jgi:hypothetical protein
MQVADELRGAIGEVTDVLTRASELAFSDAGAHLAGILLADGAVPVQVTLRRAHRGNRYPLYLSTYVGVEAIGPKDYDDEELRRQVTRIIGQSARVFGARWREQDAHDWPLPRPNLILNVWSQLRAHRMVLDTARGHLAAMFDARGRPLGDPRLSLVRTVANMPRRR